MVILGTMGICDGSQPGRSDSGCIRHKAVIIEFTGTSGVGKTTLVEAVNKVLRNRGFRVIEAYDVILECCGLAASYHSKWRTLAIDAIALGPFLNSLRQSDSRRLFRLAARAIFRDGQVFLTKLNLLRNVIKRVGVHCILRAIQKRGVAYDIIVADEGSLHIAQNTFAHVKTNPDRGEIETFAAVVPKPDLVVWVTAPVAQSVTCILERRHKRVQNSYYNVEAFVFHSTYVYEVLFSLQSMQGDLLTVHNDSSQKADNCLAVESSRIADSIETLRREYLYST